MLHPSRASALLAVSFASGASALVYQTVWLRWFRVLFGNTAYAASATLCAFFLGLAIGAVLFGRLAGRTLRPLRLYARIEVAACLVALLVPAIIGLYDPFYASLYGSLADSRETFVLAKFGLALLALLPATVLLGGTLPPLASAFVRDPAELGRAGNRLYAMNTAGAVLGTVLGALTLPEWIGVNATYAVAIGLALLAAGAAASLERGSAPPPAPAPSESGRAPRLLLWIAFASGFGTLALEILLLRALSQVTASSVYSYGAVLLVVLIALAAGAALVAESAGRVRPVPLLIGALVFEALLLLILPAVTAFSTSGLSIWVGSDLWGGLALAAALGGLPLLVGALVLPLTFRMGEVGAVGPRIGGLLAANTLGSVLGSLVASFVLLDGVGLWTSFVVIAGLYTLTALTVAPTASQRIGVGLVVGAAAGIVFATPASPRRLPLVSAQPGLAVLAVEEGAHGVVSVVERGDMRGIKVDNHYTLGGTGSGSNDERPGHIALLLHPDPKRVLFLGSATGGTAASGVTHPVDEIVLVELVPEVHDLAATYFGEVTRGVHRDPRTRLVIEDGRNHLRAAPEQYDAVVSDLFVPWRPGVGSLYTQEHFRAVRDHLTDGGVFAQWLPLYQLRQIDFELIAATFLTVFPDATLWRADFSANFPRIGLIGIRGEAPSIAQVQERISVHAAGEVDDVWTTDPTAFWMLYGGPLARYVTREVAPNRDGWPRFEFIAGRSSPRERNAFLQEGWWRLAEVAGTAGDDVFPDPPAPGPRYGAMLHHTVRLLDGPRREEGQALLRELRLVVPEALLSGSREEPAARAHPSRERSPQHP